jgi:Domain of unknown function (DUF4190)
METNEEIPYSPVNSQSVLSLVFGILTLVFFCTGWLPIPFSSVICFPLSTFLGFLALIFGIIALNRIRKHNHSGSPMAWLGITIGGLVFLCLLCTLILIASLFIFAPNTFHMPPFLQNYQI